MKYLLLFENFFYILESEIFDLNLIKKPNGGIGNQGVTFEQARDIMSHLGIKVDYNGDGLKQIVQHLKDNPVDLEKLLNFTKNNPIKLHELPDKTYHLDDGHHRATLLYYSGIQKVPAEIINKGEYI